MSKFRKFARLTSTYSMTPSEQILWQRIKRFEIDDPSSEFTFTNRLARENGWSLGYAIRAVYEYKKFIFLVCTTAHPLTPSDAVDQVWHLHLLYTDSYWIDWCQRTLEQEIKHGPTKGGKAEKEKFHDCWFDAFDTAFDSAVSSDSGGDGGSGCSGCSGCGGCGGCS